MKIQSFLKRLNAIEIGKGVTNDTYIAIPNEVDLSGMFSDRVALSLFDRYTGRTFAPPENNIQYVETGQNNQIRISGLGKYCSAVNAEIGDEILVERKDVKDTTFFSLDFHHRHAIVFLKNRDYVEILPNKYIDNYIIPSDHQTDGHPDYQMHVSYLGESHVLTVKFIIMQKKKITSPEATAFYDLLIDGTSILGSYSYQDYIEVLTDDMRMNKMRTYTYASIETED